MKMLPALLIALPLCIPVSIRAADEPATASGGAKAAAIAALTGSAGYLERARELVVNALAMIGVNYKFGGNNPDDGFDCSGLVGHVFRSVAGLVLPRDSQAMSKVGDRVEKTELQPGDLVFFNTRHRPYSHVGIYIGEQRFVHAPSRGREVQVVDMGERYWQTRYNGARRVSF